MGRIVWFRNENKIITAINLLFRSVEGIPQECNKNWLTLVCYLTLVAHNSSITPKGSCHLSHRRQGKK